MLLFTQNTVTIFEGSVHNKFVVNFIVTKIIRFYEKADEVWIFQPTVEETIRDYGFKIKIEVVSLGNDFTCTEPIGPIKRKARENLQILPDETTFYLVGFFADPI